MKSLDILTISLQLFYKKHMETREENLYFDAGEKVLNISITILNIFTIFIFGNRGDCSQHSEKSHVLSKCV